MEQFCRAYVQAVAAAAGCHILSWQVDDDRIDITLARRAEFAIVRGARLDIQLKATTSNCLRENDVSFPLDIATFDALRASNVMVPRVLVVLLMHEDVAEWSNHSESRLALRKCAYWLSIRGLPQTDNATSKTVHLPRSQRFDARAVDEIFTRIEGDALP